MEKFTKPENLTNSNSLERLKEIEDYLQEYYKKYKVGLNASQSGSTQGTELANSFWSSYMRGTMEKDFKDLINLKLKDKTLIDLGVGADGSNIPSYTELPVKKYIGVDIDEQYANSEYAIKKMNSKGIEAAFCKEDMLRYLSKLPDKSANFFLSAIDYDVILDKQYWEYLTQELLRTTEDNGIIIEGGMVYLERYLKNENWKLISEISGGKKIFEKLNN